MKWYFVRHGEIEANIDKVYAGWSDEGLTARGRKQAAEAAEALSGIGISAIYSSPIERAMETAGIIGNTLDLTPIPDEGFKELKMGPWEGLSEHEVADRYPDQWETWNTRPADLAVAGRETLQELLERVLDGVGRLRSGAGARLKMNVEHRTSNIQHRMGEDRAGGHGPGNVLVVTHVAIIRVLILHAENRDLNEYKQVPVPGNGEVLELADELIS